MQYSRYGALMLSILSSALPVLGAPASTNENSLTPRDIGAGWMIQAFANDCSDATPLWTRTGGIDTVDIVIAGLIGQCVDFDKVGTYLAEIDISGVSIQFSHSRCSDHASLGSAGPLIYKGSDSNQKCAIAGKLGWQSYNVYNNTAGGT